MSRTMFASIGGFGGFGIASLAHAHPGHGPDGWADGVQHYLATPEHGLAVVLGLLVFGLWATAARRTPGREPTKTRSRP